MQEPEVVELAATGYFNQLPPVSKGAPCGQMWRRLNPKTVPLYTQQDVSWVLYCTWVCTASCCRLRPQLNELYFQPPSPMLVSHKVLVIEMWNVYKGDSFTMLCERAELAGEVHGEDALLLAVAHSGTP
jgi:hypothetical protein